MWLLTPSTPRMGWHIPIRSVTRTDHREPKYMLQEGDILVSNVRPNRGAVTLIGKLRSGCLASSGFSLLRQKKKAKIPQAYVFAFLKSRFGRLQLERRCRGSMYPAIGYDDLVDIWVPRVPTVVCDRVREAVAEGLGFQEEFFGLIREQAAMLEEFLRPIGAPPSPLTGDTNKANWTEVRRSESLLEGTAERVDAEFFRREYAEFDERLKRAMPTFLLGEHFSLSPGRGLGNGEEIVPLIKQGILTNAGVNWSAISHEEGKCIHSDGCVD